MGSVLIWGIIAYWEKNEEALLSKRGFTDGGGARMFFREAVQFNE